MLTIVDLRLFPARVRIKVRIKVKLNLFNLHKEMSLSSFEVFF